MKSNREIEKIMAGSLWGCEVLTTKEEIMEACRQSCSPELIKWCHNDENKVYESGCCLGKLNLNKCEVLNKSRAHNTRKA